MPAGASQKREREYKELEQRFKKEHRYKGREEEVAARIVNKQRAQYGETKSEKDKDRSGNSPDKDLPLQNYQHMTISEITPKLKSLSTSDLEDIRTYEKKHKNRKGVLSEIDKAVRNKKDDKTGE